MKKIGRGVLPLVLFVQVLYGQTCGELTGCAKKVCELEVKLKNVSEPHAMARIQTALSETKANCSEGKSVIDDEHQMKIEHKIREANEDISEAQLKKEKAQSEGKLDKVAKYQHKIEEKQLKIKALEAEK